MEARLYLNSRMDTLYTLMESQLLEGKREDPFSQAFILLPSTGIIDDVMRRLKDSIGYRFLQFFSLGQEVLLESGISIQEINMITVRWLIRRILTEMAYEGELSTFIKVWEKPGFQRVIQGWIQEMKGQGITPEAYVLYARDTGSAKDRELAMIYTHYQDFMHKGGYSDSDGLLWLAAEELEQDPLLYKKDIPLYVLGFDQFTPVQLRILDALAGRLREANIYLLWDQNRDQHSLPMARLWETKKTMQSSIPLEIVTIPNEIDQYNFPRTLQRTHQQLFEKKKGYNKDDLVKEIGPGSSEGVYSAGKGDPGGLRLVEAPSPESEVRWALREAKRLLLSGNSPLDIAILSTDKAKYLPIVRQVGAEYGISVDIDQPLIQNPAVATLASLLRLPPDFPWAETFHVLRSPYIRQVWFDDNQLDMLDRLSRERPVIAGKEQWKFAVQPPALDILDVEDEDLGPPPLAAILSEEALIDLKTNLDEFFNTLIPPEKATYQFFTWWLQTRLIGFFPQQDGMVDLGQSETTLDLLSCCCEGIDPNRDISALQDVLNLLRQLVQAFDILMEDSEVDWVTYRDEVMRLLADSSVSKDLRESGVRFDALEGARGRVVEYLFILGLSEGEFPRSPTPDPLYTSLERESHPLPLIRYSPANDASLWWQAIGGVKKELTLLRPYIDQNGAPWSPSPYWEAVIEICEETRIETLPIADVPKPENAASQAELLTALTSEDIKEIPSDLREKRDYSWQAVAIMNQRESFQPAGVFEGVIKSIDLKGELSSHYEVGHTWSASRLNRYANCPYGFFAEYVLKLEPYPDPEEGLDAMQRGSLLHTILEHLYKKIIINNLFLTRDNLEIILHYLQETCEAIFPLAPRRYGFRPGALWEYEKEELMRLVSALVSWECEGNGLHARFQPYLLEERFGIDFKGTPALSLDVQGVQFHLRGVVDRVDRDEKGNLRVIDYKSGSTTYSKNDMKKGLAMQTALYALVAERYWLKGKGRVVDSQYWLIPSRTSSGRLTFEGDVREDEVADDIIQQAAWCVEQIRSGSFPSAPAKPVQWGRACSNRCDYAPICRVSRQSIVKARREGWR